MLSLIFIDLWAQMYSYFPDFLKFFLTGLKISKNPEILLKIWQLSQG